MSFPLLSPSPHSLLAATGIRRVEGSAGLAALGLSPAVPLSVFGPFGC